VAYPGAELVVGTELAGMIVLLKMQEKEKVRKGQVLAAMKPEDTRVLLVEIALLEPTP
jgi:multidrug resistance efflux pump